MERVVTEDNLSLLKIGLDISCPGFLVWIQIQIVFLSGYLQVGLQTPYPLDASLIIGWILVSHPFSLFIDLAYTDLILGFSLNAVKS